MDALARDEHYSPFGPMPAPRVAQPGEELYELEMDELRDFGEYGVEAQILISGELWQSCRFFGRDLAVRWAEGIRDRLIRGEPVD